MREAKEMEWGRKRIRERGKEVGMRRIEGGIGRDVEEAEEYERSILAEKARELNERNKKR